MSHVDSASGLHDDHREIRHRRLLFRCWHRGTQEIDLIFGTFAESAGSGFKHRAVGPVRSSARPAISLQRDPFKPKHHPVNRAKGIPVQSLTYFSASPKGRT